MPRFVVHDATHNAGQSPHTAKFRPWKLITCFYRISWTNNGFAFRRVVASLRETMTDLDFAG
jgi:hypothetical protein